MGATRRQMLLKVQLPLARRMLLLGVNQTILFALSMVVIAGLIGGGGLGAVVNSGLFSNPALAILAGFVIVIMAMALDRVDRGDRRAHRPGEAPPRRRGATRAAHPVGDRRRRVGRRRRRGEGARRQRHLSARGRRAAALGHAAALDPDARSSRCSTTCRTRTTGSSRSPSRRAPSSCRSCCCRSRHSSMEGPWFVTLARPRRDRVRDLRSPARRSRRS